MHKISVAAILFLFLSMIMLYPDQALIDEILNEMENGVKQTSENNPPSPLSDIVPALELMTDANELFDDREYQKALEIYSQVMSADPKIQIEAKIAALVCRIEISLRTKDQEVFKVNNEFKKIHDDIAELKKDDFFSSQHQDTEIFLRSRLFIQCYLEIMEYFCRFQHYDSWHQMGARTVFSTKLRIQRFITDEEAPDPIPGNASIQHDACYNYLVSERIREKDFQGASAMLKGETPPQKKSDGYWKPFLEDLAEVKSGLSSARKSADSAEQSLDPVKKLVPKSMKNLKEVQSFLEEMNKALCR